MPDAVRVATTENPANWWVERDEPSPDSDPPVEDGPFAGWRLDDFGDDERYLAVLHEHMPDQIPKSFTDRTAEPEVDLVTDPHAVLGVLDSDDDLLARFPWLAEVDLEADADDEPDDDTPFLGFVDLGEVMRRGVKQPEMLVPNLIVRGHFQSWYGMKECGKTWVLAATVADLLRGGKTVVWVDKEMGRESLAERFAILGVPADVLSERLVYLEYPVLDESRAARRRWEWMLDVIDPALIVADAQMELLADANLNENLTADVLRWLSWYFEPARKRGITFLMLDHTGHESQGRARGASGKGQAAKVELEFTKEGKFDRERTGLIKVTRRKNTVAADVAEEQHLQLGGDGEGGFIFMRWEPTIQDELNGSDVSGRLQKQATEERVKSDILKRVDEHGTVSMTQLRELVTGKASLISLAVGELRDEGLLIVEPIPRGGVAISLPPEGDE